MHTPSKEDLDNLFGPMFEEYYEQKSSDTSIYSAAQPTQVHEDSPSTLIEFKSKKSVVEFDGIAQFFPYNLQVMRIMKSSTTGNGLDELRLQSTFYGTERMDADFTRHSYCQTLSPYELGGLMYLTASRLDIAFATFVCARYQDVPYSKHPQRDAYHAGCKDDCKSTLGGLQFLGGKLVIIIMAQQQHAAEVHPDELCPPNKRYDLMDANKKVDLEHFWNTLKEDGSKYRLKFMLDKNELSLTLDDFRTIFHLPEANDDHHNSFVLPPSFLDMVPFYKQQLGFTMELKTSSSFKTTGLLQPWKTL
ncbi:hypothetical protein Tco_0909324 [Tanacetum coccineum]|uniref:Uncharacterized protein n=1 Tax=Tanacetum coccineum TaxID=301880 RepID=A0ABQ5CWW6_9ASTR